MKDVVALEAQDLTATLEPGVTFAEKTTSPDALRLPAVAVEDPVVSTRDTVNGPGSGERLYRISGDFLELRFEGKAVHVRNSKGMRYIAELLRSPGRSFGCLELRAALSANSSRRAQVDEESRVDLHPAGFDSSEILDPTARKDYRDRLDSIEKELREAELNNNLGRHEQLIVEREWIINDLKAATGLSGRPRMFATETEKARKAVSGAINDALKAIKKHHPQLATHLDDRIERGTSCRYTGDGTDWEG